MYQETLVILKPDTLERNMAGSIIKYYEDAGLKVLDMKFYEKVTKERLTIHYPDTMALSIGKKAQAAVPSIKDAEAHGMKVLTALRGYFSRAPVLAIKLGGEDAIREVRRITGYTDPSTADKGTVRGDLGVDSIAKSTEEDRAVENLIHASGNPEEAEAELKLWL
ncbi:nucleoside-diphosphate kinase [Candidatus Bathyarchaeota archaeon]|jgi:nucleoside-diphosphate kinase|nr:nucleoside-diphosphate kinase [Candidatus Bathyarchaeota archaeon]MBT4320205.1 nucleoside-diphosphate kinase [Candidatus Bathyarchaeota archaeon]MBT4423374.1 nucleoside-diphosphate kinase [Candidatus Bathyarchaeota archaeon]MBT5642374.1 nucleoside-diphosphate kinase [Candidatus Bathyarchaeota archaeon]MBT6603950.1 nucleoside-diphosphate kinase [Candidatus Bathyarchaeota archaeon]